MIPPVFQDPTRMAGLVDSLERVADNVERITRHVVGAGNATEKAKHQVDQTKRSLDQLDTSTKKAKLSAEQLSDQFIKRLPLGLGTMRSVRQQIAELGYEAARTGTTIERQLVGRLTKLGTGDLTGSISNIGRSLAMDMRHLGGGLVGPGGLLGMMLYGMAGEVGFRAQANQVALAFDRIGSSANRVMAGQYRGTADRLVNLYGKEAYSKLKTGYEAAAEAGFRLEDQGAEDKQLSGGLFGRGTVGASIALDEATGQGWGTLIKEAGTLSTQTGEGMDVLTKAMMETWSTSQRLGVSFQGIKQALSGSLGTLGLAHSSYQQLLGDYTAIADGLERISSLEGAAQRKLRGEVASQGLSGLAGAFRGQDTGHQVMLARQIYGEGIDAYGSLARLRMGAIGGYGQNVRGEKINPVLEMAKYADTMARRVMGKGQDLDTVARRRQYMMDQHKMSPEAVIAAERLVTAAASGQSPSEKALHKLQEAMKTPQEKLLEYTKKIATGIDPLDQLLEKMAVLLGRMGIALAQGLVGIGQIVASPFDSALRKEGLARIVHGGEVFKQAGLDMGSVGGTALGAMFNTLDLPKSVKQRLAEEADAELERERARERTLLESLVTTPEYDRLADFDGSGNVTAEERKNFISLLQESVETPGTLNSAFSEYKNLVGAAAKADPRSTEKWVLQKEAQKARVRLSQAVKEKFKVTTTDGNNNFHFEISVTSDQGKSSGK